MKFLFPVALTLLTVACSAPPKPGTEAHQRQLAEEARENFLALQARERQSNRPIASTEAPARTKKPPLKPFQLNQPFAFTNPFARAQPAPTVYRGRGATPAPSARPPKPTANADRLTRAERNRRAADTVYYYDVRRRPEPPSPRYRAYKIQYARELAKRPEDLTSEEREWVRRHYRD